MRPPGIARGLVKLLADPSTSPFLLRDLDERFQELVAVEGLRAARRWYWSQALSAVPSAVIPNGRQFLQYGRQAVGDARLALRSIRRRPLYSVSLAGTLGLGLAAATTTFAVAWTVWLAPLGIPDPDRVVRLYEFERSTLSSADSPSDPLSARHQLSPTLLEDFREHDWRTVESVSAFLTGFASELNVNDGSVNYSSVVVSPEGFDILGIVPTLGRLPTQIETELVISERFWRAEFGGDPNIAGTHFTDDLGSVAIVGVASFPSGIPGDPDAVSMLDWRVSGDADEENRAVRFIDAVARLREGSSVEAAEAEMSAFVASLGQEYPAHQGWSVDAVRLSDDLIRPFRSVLSLLLAAGAIFLMLAGVNVAGLIASDRMRTQSAGSVRMALGATPARLLRASAIETTVLGLIGAIGGVAAAWWVTDSIRSVAPQDVPRISELAVSPHLALGSLAAAVLISVTIGLSGHLVIPANASIGLGIKRKGGSILGRKMVVVGQVALTTLLVAGGTGVSHHLIQLRSVDLGFEPEGLWATTADISDPRYPSRDERWNAWASILEGLDAQGLHAALVANPPMAEEPVPPFAIYDESGADEFFYELHLVSSEYFSVMGVRLLAGRGFSVDGLSADGIVVSQTLADRYFGPGIDPEQVVGRVIDAPPFASSATILGVVESTRHEGPSAKPTPELYVPFTSFLSPPGTVLLRGDRSRVVEAVTAVTSRVDPDLRWSPLIPYTLHLREWFAPLRLQTQMIGAFGVLGLLLVSLGIYSVMAHQVASTRHEIGVRKAVGARDTQLMRVVLLRGAALAIVGASIGLLFWHLLLPWSRGLVEGIDSAGALVPLAVTVVVGGTCALSTVVPALRAARVDPTVTLKAD